MHCRVNIWARRKSLKQKPHLTEAIAIWKEIVLFSVIWLCRRGRSALTKYQFQVTGTKHSHFNPSGCLPNLRLATHAFYFFEAHFHMPSRYWKFPRTVPQKHLLFLQTSVYGTDGKQLAYHLLEQQKQNNYTKYTRTHTHTSLYMLTHFLLRFLPLNLPVISHGSLSCCKIEFLSARRSHFQDLWILHSFRQIAFHATGGKTTASLRETLQPTLPQEQQPHIFSSYFLPGRHFPTSWVRKWLPDPPEPVDSLPVVTMALAEHTGAGTMLTQGVFHRVCMLCMDKQLHCAMGDKKHQTEKVAHKHNLQLLTVAGDTKTCMSFKETTWNLIPSHSIPAHTGTLSVCLLPELWTPLNFM